MDNLYFFCVFITIAGVELLSRLTFPDHADDDKYLSMAFTKLLNSSVVFDSSQQNYSKKFGFRLSANAEKRMVSDEFEFTARTNSLGFRSKEISPKRNDEYRVLLLGDTFFWGMGVEEENMISSNLELMESQLSIPHLSLSVYNYSMPGYNTSQESLVLRAYAHQVNPDHVILGFFPGNDVIPNALTFIDEEGNIASHHEMIQRVKKNLRRSFSLLFHSIVFRILVVSTYVPKVRYEIATRGEIIRRSYALLKELKRETQSLGSWLSVVIIHPRDSVSGGLVQAWSKSREVGYMIRDFCHKNNIEVIDMLDYMHGHEAKRKYFYQKDGHFNKEGNYLVSRTIFQKCLRDRTILRNTESVE